MAGYVSPTGNVANSWVNPTNAYDEDTGTTSSRNVATYAWSTYLELTHASLQCSKVRIWTNTSVVNFSLVEIDVYYGAAWHNIYSGTWTVLTWLEYSIGSTQAVTSMRARFCSVAETTKTASIYEADFYEEAVAFIPWAIIM